METKEEIDLMSFVENRDHPWPEGLGVKVTGVDPSSGAPCSSSPVAASVKGALASARTRGGGGTRREVDRDEVRSGSRWT